MITDLQKVKENKRFNILSERKIESMISEYTNKLETIEVYSKIADLFPSNTEVVTPETITSTIQEFLMKEENKPHRSL